MSVLKNFQQSKRPSARTVGLVVGTTLAVAAVYYHNKRIEDLEGKVDMLLTGGTVTAEAVNYLMEKAKYEGILAYGIHDNGKKLEVSS